MFSLFAKIAGRAIAAAAQIAGSVILSTARGLSIAARRIIGAWQSTGRAFRLFARSKRTAKQAAAAARASLARELAEELIEEAQSFIEEAEEIILAAFNEAIDTMANMTANEGQRTVFLEYVFPAFAEALETSEPEDGWPSVDIGEYMTFMGIIVEAGNQIMEAAYNDAAPLIDDAMSVL